MGCCIWYSWRTHIVRFRSAPVFGAAGRCKLYRLEKDKGTDEYKDFGSGILRLNKHKETGRRRVRTSGGD